MRAFRKLDGHSCPGELECTTNKFTGEIGGLHGKAQGRTLENYCHKEIPTKDNKLHQGCPLFDTKPENTPPSLYGAIEAAETLRRYKSRGCLPSIHELTAWEFCCFDAAEEASEKIEAEMIKESSSKDSSSSVNKDTPLGKLGHGGGAFDSWDKS